MWMIAEYEATSLFTLKPATATASGGKTLLVPTPYSIKMALLNVGCYLEGVAAGEAAWPWLAEIGVALRPAQNVVVNHTFAKVLRPRRNPAEPGSADEGYFGRTIAYREYAYLHDPFALALSAETDEQVNALARWMLNINYLGRRGSFIQMIGLPRAESDLPEGFIHLDVTETSFSLSESLLTQLDDVGDRLTFARASIYTDEKITLGKHRILRHITLPYRRVASSRRYTHYERSDE